MIITDSVWGDVTYSEVCGCEKGLDHLGLQHHPITVTPTQMKMTKQAKLKLEKLQMSSFFQMVLHSIIMQTVSCANRYSLTLIT